MIAGSLGSFGTDTGIERKRIGVKSLTKKEIHENRTTTEIYLHSIGESEREAMAIYELFTEKSYIETKEELSQLD